ncbi:MAG: tRNA preQ1(34) S-adenosylmethionine ribosyltransferase-isomerase QueA [Clostridia bacterium]|nr:tRNA preQ1(34) S-adenosylmethionine ribosyltransferase-isomerase QueA [Clostridia bacterium]MDE6471992.1 tRNA preQ1(34) S-adenosylmethionine ribosyltransferase-isomerase QueA [Clostridia bacterium]
MKTSDFFYELPQELIAQTPIEPRDASRLLIYHKENSKIDHKHFYDVIDYLQKGDVLVINNTKVIPARIFATRLPRTDKTIEHNTEILLLKRKEYDVWECITRPAKKLKIGTRLDFGKMKGEVIGFGEEGVRFIKFAFDGVFENILEEIGNMPLPPYITEKLEDKSRYQTVYSKVDGSSAAPTAGLHFTPQLLQKIEEKGVQIAKVLLHVGLGTFRPVKEDDILNHKMHSEYFEIDDVNAKIINDALAEHRRVICVGTTSVRVVESAVGDDGFVKPSNGETQIFIYPGYKFKVVKGLITNFHLPESTLIMLVSALIGRENTLNVYNTAVKERYRFFSFGDAMLIL